LGRNTALLIQRRLKIGKRFNLPLRLRGTVRGRGCASSTTLCGGWDRQQSHPAQQSSRSYYRIHKPLQVKPPHKSDPPG
jgi:hypothetical protein